MSSRRRGRGFVAAVAGGATLAFALAACTPPPTDDGGGDAAGGGERDFSGDCADFEKYGDLSGTTVSIYTSIVAPEDQPHIDAYVPFEECTGADVEYEGSREFEAQLPVRLQSGQAPDIAFIPQPGLLQTLVRDYPDQVVPVSDAAEENVDQYYDPAWKEYGSVDGEFYGSPHGANVKSFVWYSPSMFEEAGYEIPQTMDELLALSDQIVADGGTPWCAGIESQDATGWPATDWLEDMVLRTAGPEVYDQWVTHEIPFDDPQILEALEAAGAFLKNPEYVNAGFGDVQSIASTPFTDAGFPILDGECWMHRQAGFYAANWAEYQEDAVVAEDGDVFAFYLPAETTDERPVLGGGEFTTAFADRPEVAAFQAYLTSPEWVNTRIGSPGFVVAHSEQDTSQYESPIDQLSAEILADESAVFRFDASDLMPGEVGSSSFWTEMVNWIANDKSSEEVLTAIEASWPASS